MDATNGDDEAMMAMMGLSGFGTTKVRFIHQEGAVGDCPDLRTRASTSRATKMVRPMSRRCGRGVST